LVLAFELPASANQASGMAASEGRLFYDGLSGYAQRRGRHSEKLSKRCDCGFRGGLFFHDSKNLITLVTLPRKIPFRNTAFCSPVSSFAEIALLAGVLTCPFFGN
jgi:hypothetical protein